MKLLIFCIISTLSFIFGWCERESNCASLPSTIQVDVFINLLEVESTHWCRQEWRADFWKQYCNGETIAKLSYEYKDCYAFEGQVFIQKQSQGV